MKDIDHELVFPRVGYYSHTELAETLMDPLMVMAGWAMENLAAIKEHRRVYDAGAR